MRRHIVPPRPGPGWFLIFRASRRGPDGKKLKARDFGYRAWPIWIRRK